MAFVSQRVYAIESCRNLEIVVHALKKVRDLLLLMAKATDRQLEILTTLDNETDVSAQSGMQILGGFLSTAGLLRGSIQNSQNCL